MFKVYALTDFQGSTPTARRLLDYLAVCDDNGLERIFLSEWMVEQHRTPPELTEKRLAKAEEYGLLIGDTATTGKVFK